MTKRTWALAVAAFVGVTVVVFLLTAPSNQPTTSSVSIFQVSGIPSTSTVTTSATSSGSSIPSNCALSQTIRSELENVSLDVYLTPNPTVGESVCLGASILGPPVITFVEFTVLNSTGTLFFQQTFVPPTGGPDYGSVFTDWNTTQTFQGATPSEGQYELYATIHPYNAAIEATGLYNDTATDFTLG